MENKQTSVEWLQECLSIHLTDEQKMQFEGLFQQALAMERIQVIYAYDDGTNERHNDPVTGEQYYNEQYGK
jgi:hypothetical protein